jgi:purine-binding chemotaxis protein CheW
MTEARYNSATDTLGHEFLVFKLGAAEYGIDILKVREIRGCEPVTHVASMPTGIKGVVNLRGVIVPIVDLRERLGLESAEYTTQTVTIILGIGARVVGAVVDSVSDVLTLTPDEISAPPQFATSMKMDYLTGIGTLGTRMLLLTDIEKLLESDALVAPDTATP